MAKKCRSWININSLANIKFAFFSRSEKASRRLRLVSSKHVTQIPHYSSPHFLSTWPISNVQSENVLEVSPVYDQRNETEKEPLSETFVN